MKATIRMIMGVSLLVTGLAFGQGEDSQTSARDLQVIATMLPGEYDNRNQSYFDTRGKSEDVHRRVHLSIERHNDETIGEHVFSVATYWDNDVAVTSDTQIFSLVVDDENNAVKMHFQDSEACDLLWRREAEQFRATLGQDCSTPLVSEVVLGARQLWFTDPQSENGGYKLHRARKFECYADIPGVGGGRDEEYNRYDGFKIHDQGGEAWFETKDGRDLGIQLWAVDWPINNLEGIFTRDSLVIYVNEKLEDSQKQHGYAFTVPEADRVGINLKWLLASCFMLSNEFATPSM